MRAWISDGLIRLARRINPATGEDTGTTNIYYNFSDPADKARCLRETQESVEKMKRRRAAVGGY